MFIFETENRIKLSSHNTDQINHQSGSCLKNQSLAGFWMLHEKNRLKFSLWHYLSRWPLLTAFPLATDEGSNILVAKPVCSHRVANQRVTFFLELNHDTLTIWYQIDQCHFAYTAKSLVPYLKLCGLLTQLSIFSTSYPLQINGRKAFHIDIGLFCPCSISFNDNAIVWNFYSKKFHSSKLFKDWLPTWRELVCIRSPLITEPCLTYSQAYHSHYSVTGPIS